MPQALVRELYKQGVLRQLATSSVAGAAGEPAAAAAAAAAAPASPQRKQQVKSPKPAAAAAEAKAAGAKRPAAAAAEGGAGPAPKQPRVAAAAGSQQQQRQQGQTEASGVFCSPCQIQHLLRLHFTKRDQRRPLACHLPVGELNHPAVLIRAVGICIGTGRLAAKLAVQPFSCTPTPCFRLSPTCRRTEWTPLQQPRRRRRRRWQRCLSPPFPSNQAKVGERARYFALLCSLGAPPASEHLVPCCQCWHCRRCSSSCCALPVPCPACSGVHAVLLLLWALAAAPSCLPHHPPRPQPPTSRVRRHACRCGRRGNVAPTLLCLPHLVSILPRPSFFASSPAPCCPPMWLARWTHHGREGKGNGRKKGQGMRAWPEPGRPSTEILPLVVAALLPLQS